MFLWFISPHIFADNNDNLGLSLLPFFLTKYLTIVFIVLTSDSRENQNVYQIHLNLIL